MSLREELPIVGVEVAAGIWVLAASACGVRVWVVLVGIALVIGGLVYGLREAPPG